jgi:modulator of FtsH protease HflC
MSRGRNVSSWDRGSNRGPVLALAVIVLLVGGFILGRSVMYTVNERELAVILEFGNPVASRTEPGLYFKTPFVQEVRRLPKTKQFWRSNDRDPLVDLPTADGKKIEVSAWAVWRIVDPEKFVRVMRDMDNAERAVQVRVRSAIRNAITKHDLTEVVRSTDRRLTYSFQFELPDTEAVAVEGEETGPAQPGAITRINVGREKIMAQVKAEVMKQLSDAVDGDETDRGIELVDVGISTIEFVPIVREAAFERLKAFMESIASGYYNSGVQKKQEILNMTRAEVEKLLGEGEQQSSVIRGNTDAKVIADYAKAIEETGDLFDFTRTLEVYTNSLQGKTRLILTTDSDLFRLLKQVEGTAARPKPDSGTTAARPTSEE